MGHGPLSMKVVRPRGNGEKGRAGMAGQMTAEALAIKAKQAKPTVRYAYGVSHGGGTVAAWSTQYGRWIPVAGQLIGSGEWYALEHELLINGKPVTPQSGWTEVLN